MLHNARNHSPREISLVSSQICAGILGLLTPLMIWPYLIGKAIFVTAFLVVCEGLLLIALLMTGRVYLGEKHLSEPWLQNWRLSLIALQTVLLCWLSLILSAGWIITNYHDELIGTWLV